MFHLPATILTKPRTKTCRSSARSWLMLFSGVNKKGSIKRRDLGRRTWRPSKVKVYGTQYYPWCNGHKGNRQWQITFA